MKHVGDLLAGLPLPEAPAAASGWNAGRELVHDAVVRDLGADLPAGHLHLWGGPQGAGKTSFLLKLLLGSALRGRRGLYVTYHLPAASLALRLLGMAAEVDVDALGTGHLGPEAAQRAALARAALTRLPLHVLEARGFSVTSIEDRVVRMPFRAEVVAVDYLQAVVRSPGEEPGATVRSLSHLASRLHTAVVVAQQANHESGLAPHPLADRAGWIAPSGGSGLRRADVIQNRYGDRPSLPLRLDRSSGALEHLS